jgi:hypothetical protein
LKKFILAAAALAASTTASLAEWTKIGPGPNFEIAEAQCNLMAMGAERGHIAYGSPSFVAGAAVGSAIGNSMRRSYVRKNCMVLQGWKDVPIKGQPVAANPARIGKVKPVRAGKSMGAMCAKRPQDCGGKTVSGPSWLQ